MAVQPLGDPGGVGVEAEAEGFGIHAQGAGVAEGVAADLVTGGVQRLQVRNPELVAVHVDPVREAAADIVGGLHAMVGEDRPGLGPGAGREVVEAQGEDAARRRDGHRVDVEIARGPPAHLVDLLHAAVIARGRLRKGLAGLRLAAKGPPV